MKKIKIFYITNHINLLYSILFYSFYLILKFFQNKYGAKFEIDFLKNKQIDSEEQAYFNAKKKVMSIHKAKKLDKIKK